MFIPNCEAHHVMIVNILKCAHNHLSTFNRAIWSVLSTLMVIFSFSQISSEKTKRLFSCDVYALSYRNLTTHSDCLIESKVTIG